MPSISSPTYNRFIILYVRVARGAIDSNQGTFPKSPQPKITEIRHHTHLQVAQEVEQTLAKTSKIYLKLLLI